MVSLAKFTDHQYLQLSYCIPHNIVIRRYLGRDGEGGRVEGGREEGRGGREEGVGGGG